MKLSRRFGYAIVFIITASMVFAGAWLVNFSARTTFAEGTEENLVESADASGAKFVTFYDDGTKTTVKTDAATVGEALERAGITLGAGDKVEPATNTAISASNFFVNIYRARPVIVRDGVVEKYLMTASYDFYTIAQDAGMVLYDGDEIKMVKNEGFLENGVANVYEITRNGGHTLTLEEEIPFTEERIKDYTMAPGTTEVRQLGEVGTKKVYYHILYIDGKEVSREYLGEEIVREPVKRIVAEGASLIEQKPLTAVMGVNYYTVEVDGAVVLRRETFYDLPMSGVMKYCGGGEYHIREDGVKVDADGYVLVAARLDRYPRCSVVETSLGLGKVYDTGLFAETNPEQFDLATDWTNKDGK